jgi:uncharacterized membrane protein
MSHVRMTAHFDAPIEQVFALAIDRARLPEWNVNYDEAPEASGPPDQVGTRLHGTIKLLGRKMEGTAEVVEVDAPRLYRTESAEADKKLSITYRFTPASAGTDAELISDYELPAGVFGKVVDRLFIERSVERDLRHSIENFKALVEAKVPAPA